MGNTSPATPETAVPKEVSITSDWSGLLDDGAAAAVVVALEGATAAAQARYAGGKLLVVDDFMTPAECLRLNDATEHVGYGRTDYPKDYRGNLRLITVDKELARVLWARLRPLVPAETVDVCGDRWEAVGLNECFRLAKYRPGDQFQSHVDAVYKRSSDERSMFTVNVYTNDVSPADGGRTRFYAMAPSSFFRDDDVGAPDLEIRPRAGRAVVFRQPPSERILHDGERLTGGVKYLLRTDVMYRRLMRPSSPDSDEHRPI